MTMRKRKYEGFLSEEMENYLDMTEGMSYEEAIEFDKMHPEILSESANVWEEIDMTPQELCERYGFVDMTNFFISHGVNLDDL